VTVDAKQAVEAVFREESGRIIATLIRISGSFDWAEEAMQEAFASALISWPEKGIPQSPGAWIIAAAHRKLIDLARKERTKREKQASLEYETAAVSLPEAPMSLPDDRLRLIFTCCHPALEQGAQVALTLRTLGGLTTTEIAKAFLAPIARTADRGSGGDLSDFQRGLRGGLGRPFGAARFMLGSYPAWTLAERTASG
jgi:RNA polymerase sigma-70 factor, ECF subfamily